MYSLGNLLNEALSVGRAAAGIAFGIVLVLVGGVFLAVNPELYRSGLVQLFPKDQQARVQDVLGDCGRALRLWLIGQLISMSIVAAMVTAGAFLIGLPASLALGLFAGATEFIPLIGPFIGAVPALLMAATQSTAAVVWTIILFIAIQQVESNLIIPIVQKRMVEVPPALLLFAVLAAGLLFGLLGTLVAAPLTVVTYVAVKEIYVRQMLGQQISVPGER
jgi:predicted PurR-regulated permease PerM